MTARAPAFARISTGVILAAAFAVSPLQAQDDSVDTRMTDLLAEAGNRGELIACMALYRTLRLFAGSETEAGQIAGERENDMAVINTIIWQGETETDMDIAMDAILPLSDAATELFIQRFNDNREATGSVFDDTLSERIGTCNTIRAHLMEAMQ